MNIAILIALLLAVLIIAIVAFVTVLVALLRRPRRSSGASVAERGGHGVGAAHLPYAPIPNLLSPAERDFLAVLQTATPIGYRIFAQVRLANLVQVEAWARGNKGHFYRIQAKCVDFVLCDTQTTAPCLVVELDDSSHNRPDRQARDAFVDAVLATAGIPILHVRWRQRYDPRELAGHICAKLQMARPGPAITPPHRAAPIPS
ncbi:MAG TPA: DUF2726 domain-containing protein [Roseiflexaceae bacterium]|jgi:hypothetical protein